MRVTPIASETEFKSRFDAMLRAAPSGVIRDYSFFDLPPNRPPWFDTGLRLEAGEQVTTFARGRTSLDGTDLWFGPDFQIWRASASADKSRAARGPGTPSRRKPRGLSFSPAISPANGPRRRANWRRCPRLTISYRVTSPSSSYAGASVRSKDCALFRRMGM